MSYEYDSTICCNVNEVWEALRVCLLELVFQCEDCEDGIKLRFQFGELKNSWGSDGELMLDDRDLLLTMYSGTRDQRETLLNGLNRILTSKGCAEFEEL